MKAVRDSLADAWWRLNGRCPEFWLLGLAALGWVAYLHAALTQPARPLCHAGADPVHLLTMTAAMMLPTLIEPVRFVAGHSLWKRRHGNIACFLTGYLSVWMLWGAGCALLITAATGLGRALTIGALVLAAAWQASPWKARALRECHRGASLATRGWPATRDCLRYGVVIGFACWRGCWALMLLCAATGHSPIAMIAVTAFVWWERMPARPGISLRAASLSLFRPHAG